MLRNAGDRFHFNLETGELVKPKKAVRKSASSVEALVSDRDAKMVSVAGVGSSFEGVLLNVDTKLRSRFSWPKNRPGAARGWLPWEPMQDPNTQLQS